MAEASRSVLSGLEVDTDVEVIRWPDRYGDERGQVMWDRITELLKRQGGEGPQEGEGGPY